MRTHTIKIRLTEEEHRLLKEHSAKADSVSAYIRELIKRDVTYKQYTILVSNADLLNTLTTE